MESAEYSLVSVVIPATRDDGWLREAIASVRADGYPNVEVIVVWDGRAEDCPVLPADQTVVTGGRGTPAANNAGLAVARGKFVARIDSDDISLPGRFKAQVDALLAEPMARLVVGNAVVVDSESRVIGPYPRVHSRQIAHALLKSNRLVHSSFMFRLTSKEDVAYDTRCVRMQDYELAMRLAALGPIAVVQSDVVAYRVHPGQSGRQTRSFWTYIPVILRRRQCLAWRLGPWTGATQWIRDVAWFGGQYANHIGWRDRYRALGK